MFIGEMLVGWLVRERGGEGEREGERESVCCPYILEVWKWR